VEVDQVDETDVEAGGSTDAAWTYIETAVLVAVDETMDAVRRARHPVPLAGDVTVARRWPPQDQRGRHR
jgi:hypothetical protein